MAPGRGPFIVKRLTIHDKYDIMLATKERGSNMEHINFILPIETARAICEHYGKDFAALQEFEICELLDKLIDDALYKYV